MFFSTLQTQIYSKQEYVPFFKIITTSKCVRLPTGSRKRPMKTQKREVCIMSDSAGTQLKCLRPMFLSYSLRQYRNTVHISSDNPHIHPFIVKQTVVQNQFREATAKENFTTYPLYTPNRNESNGDPPCPTVVSCTHRLLWREIPCFFPHTKSSVRYPDTAGTHTIRKDRLRKSKATKKLIYATYTGLRPNRNTVTEILRFQRYSHAPTG